MTAQQKPRIWDPFYPHPEHFTHIQNFLPDSETFPPDPDPDRSPTLVFDSQQIDKKLTYYEILQKVSVFSELSCRKGIGIQSKRTRSHTRTHLGRIRRSRRHSPQVIYHASRAVLLIERTRKMYLPTCFSLLCATS